MSPDTSLIDPQSAALLIMDYQPAILAHLDDSEQLLERSSAAIALARQNGIAVSFARVAFADGDYAQIPERNKMFAGIAQVRGMPHEAPETQVHDRLEPEPGDIVVRKTRVGAFSTTDLGEQLEARGVDTLILAGITTSGVVLSTVREAADLDYRIYVLSDASADRDPDLHEVLAEKVLPTQAQVITVEDLPGLIA